MIAAMKMATVEVTVVASGALTGCYSKYVGT